MTSKQPIGERLPGDQDVRKSAESQLIAKAAKDGKFRRELIQNPKAVISQELGIAFPKDFEVKVLEETPKSFYLVLPTVNIGAEGELSDELLESVAGGKPVTTITGGSQSGPSKHKTFVTTSGGIGQDGA